MNNSGLNKKEKSEDMKFKAIQNPDLDGDMYEIAANVVLKCSDAGMTPDDDNSNNFALLCKAIEQADVVLVDQMYILKAGEQYVLNKNIKITGIGTNCGFNVIGNDNFFEVGDECYQLEINGLTLRNTGEHIVLFSREDFKSTRMQFVRMDDCRVFGKISPFRFSQSSEINPEKTDIGIDSISICNNEFYDVLSSCFVFRNVSFNIADVKCNIIRNFDWVFFHCGTDNDSAYAQEISSSKFLLNVCDNNVVCDDECFHATGVASQNFCQKFSGILTEILRSYRKVAWKHIKRQIYGVNLLIIW